MPTIHPHDVSLTREQFLDIEPKGFTRKLVFGAVDPRHSTGAQSACKVGLAFLGTVFTLATAFLGLIYVKKAYKVYSEYQTEIDRKIGTVASDALPVGGGPGRVSPRNPVSSTAAPATPFEAELQVWVDADHPLEENREVAKQRILAYSRNPVNTALDLSGLQLTELPRALTQLERLAELNLSNNRFTSLPGVLERLPDLEKLDVSNNGLETLPSWLGSLNKLVELELKHNRCKALPEEIGRLAALKKLGLRNNQLERLPRAFEDLRGLVNVDLSQNRLTRLSILGLPALQTLAAKGNRFPKAIVDATNAYLRSLAEGHRPTVEIDVYTPLGDDSSFV